MENKMFTVQWFLQTHGPKKLTNLVEEFIRKCPEFSGDKDLVIQIGTVMGDLESVFREEWNKMRYENMSK